MDGGDVERLVILAEVERQHRDLDTEQVLLTIRRAVAQHHELATHAVLLLRPGAIPKTSSGKIQHHACRAAYLSETLEVVG